MYWLPEILTTSIVARFIVDPKKYSTKPLSDVIFKHFKMIFNHVENFHSNCLLYPWFKNFWVEQSLYSVVTKLNKINNKKKPKSLSTFHVATLYTTISHNFLVKVLSKVINFIFKTEISSRIGFFQTHQSTGHLKVQEKDISQDKLWLMPSQFLSQNIILPLEI